MCDSVRVRVNVGVCFMDFSTGIINIGQFTDEAKDFIVFVKNELSRETVSLVRGERGNAQLRGQTILRLP